MDIKKNNDNGINWISPRDDIPKNCDPVLAVIEGRRLERWTHNKAIQKAVESRRVPPELKAYLKTLRIPR